MKKRGFTLIELLVVIAVIALLLSILLPALKFAKSVAKRTLCAARLRQVGTAMRSYSQSYEYLPDALSYDKNHILQHGYAVYRNTPGDDNHWIYPDNTPIPLRWAKLYVNEYIDTPEVFYCPGNRLGQYKYESYTKPTEWGTLPQDYNTNTGSNQWVRIGFIYYPTEKNPIFDATTNAPEFATKFTQLHPSLPYATDVLHTRGNLSHQRMQKIVKETDPDYIEANEFHESDNYSVNALFADAHVSNCKDPDIYRHTIWNKRLAQQVSYFEFYYTVFRLIGSK